MKKLEKLQHIIYKMYGTIIGFTTTEYQAVIKFFFL